MFLDETEVVSERDGKTVAIVRAYDKKKLDFYRRVLPDYQVVIAKDCDNPHSLETDVELGRLSRKYKKLESLGLPRHLELRRALKGGRTNNSRFHFESDGSSEMKYYDFTSLYPTVVKQEKYPMGHPIRITKSFDKTLEKYFGLVYCSVDAPKQMRYPVLGDTYNKKFTFALCRTCAESQYDSSCPHTDEQRRLYGVWTTEELKKAIELGYKIHETFEVLHYDQHSSTLFRNYVDMWQREKQEAEGWKSYETPEERVKYVNDYNEREFKESEIKLRPELIEKNPGRRYIAKLMLNSFWGKFAQRPNLTKACLLSSHEELLALYTNSDLEILGEKRINDNVLFVTYKHLDDAQAPANVQNVVVAAFVTSYARLRLFDLVHKQESKYPNSVYYMDTDSVIFEARPGDDIPKLGNYFGDLTDELEGKTCVAASFNGAKSYSLKLIENGCEPEYVLKIKGLTLTSSALDTISHDEMIKLSKEYEDMEQEKSVVDVPQSRFVIDGTSHHIHTKNFVKKYRVTSDKRRILDKQNNTVPFGYVD